MSQRHSTTLGVHVDKLDRRQLRDHVRYQMSQTRYRDGTALTITEFNLFSRKSFEVFLTEYIEHHATIAVASHDDEEVLVVFQEKTDLRVESEGFVLMEHFREYERPDGSVERVPTPVERGMSGTRARHESAIETVMREAAEETKHVRPQLKLKVGDFELMTDHVRLGNPFEPVNWRRSSVYHKVWRIENVHHYRLRLPRRPWPELVVPERRVKVHHHWVPLSATDLPNNAHMLLGQKHE